MVTEIDAAKFLGQRLHNSPPILGKPGFSLPDESDFLCLHVVDEMSKIAAAEMGIQLVFNRAENSQEKAVMLYRRGMKRKGLRIYFSDNSFGNVIALENESGLVGSLKIFGSNCTIIDRGASEKLATVQMNFWVDHGLLYWGKNSTSNGFFSELSADGNALIFGEDCNLASEIIIRPTDMHAVVTADSGRIINRGGPVILFPHVWVGQRAMIMKRVIIGPGSIVGAASVVTKRIGAGVAVGGNPARVIRDNVVWTRTLNPSEAHIDAVRAICETYRPDFSHYVASH